MGQGDPEGRARDGQAAIEAGLAQRVAESLSAKQKGRLERERRLAGLAVRSWPRWLNVTKPFKSLRSRWPRPCVRCWSNGWVS